jgi:hypothetical protein
MTSVQILEGEHLKTGDQEPDLLVQLIKDNRTPKDLSDTGVEVELHLKEANTSGGLLVDDDTNGNVTIESDVDGTVSYSWQTADTEKAMTAVGEFVVTDSSGEQSTYPNDGTFNVYIEEGLK